jgi:hypothetical protein
VAELGPLHPTRLLGIGVASALPIFVLHGHDSTWRMLGFGLGLGIILRVWTILYLMKPSILDEFPTKRADQVSVGSSVQ